MLQLWTAFRSAVRTMNYISIVGNLQIPGSHAGRGRIILECCAACDIVMWVGFCCFFLKCINSATTWKSLKGSNDFLKSQRFSVFSHMSHVPSFQKKCHDKDKKKPKCFIGDILITVHYMLQSKLYMWSIDIKGKQNPECYLWQKNTKYKNLKL